MNTRVNDALKIIFKLPHLLSSFDLFKWIFGNSIHTKKISNTIDRIYYIIKGRFFEWHRLPIVVSNDQIHFKRCYWYEHRKVPLLYFSTSSLVLLYSWYFQINRASNWAFNEIQVNFSIQPISMRCTSLNVLNYQSTQCKRSKKKTCRTDSLVH